jgi:hypothetical protein
MAMDAAANGSQKPDVQGQSVVAIDSRGMFYVNAIPVIQTDLVSSDSRFGVRVTLNPLPALKQA